MRSIITIGLCGSLTCAAGASVTIFPVDDARVVHAQASVTPPGGEPQFGFDAISPDDAFEPWEEVAEVLLEIPGATFFGQSMQSSSVADAALIASGVSSMELSAEEGAVSSGNTCSHFILTFQIVEPTTFTLTGTLDALDGGADAYALITLEHLPSGVLVVDQLAGDSELQIDATGDLLPGEYEIRVESHGIGTVSGGAASATASFDVVFTVPERCPDLDGDGLVGITDLLLLLGSWGPIDCFPGDTCADLDGDGVAGVLDLIQMLADWGACP